MADPLSANEFIAQVERQVKPASGQKFTSLVSGQYVILGLVSGRQRFSIRVEGFDPRDKDAPAPGATIGNRGGPGIVQAETSYSDYAADLKMRKKSGTTQVIAKYVAEALNNISGAAGDARLASSVAHRYLQRS